MTTETPPTGDTPQVVPPSSNPSVRPGFDPKHPHLRLEAASLLTASEADRCYYIYQDRFILHPNAKDALAALKDIRNRPKGVRPPCLALIGGSNEGKSALIRKFLKDFEAVTDETVAGNTDQMRIVCVEMPPRATEPRTCLAIARAMGLPGYGSTKSRVVSDNVYRALKAKGVEMLILNEAQHAAHLSDRERSVTCDLMKGISNLGISVITVGTPELGPMLSHDVQIANRMRIVRLISFAKGESLSAFLNTLETFYPLPERSDLGSPELMAAVYHRTNGITGEVVQLCNAAAVHAVRTKQPCITLELLRKTIMLPPASSGVVAA
ncbi:MAG TPA: TniB family NTP-binding protein [Lacunisphaera sp.]|nr:TniB family NTP-binding protein [Lacunisphaera sp.]